MQAGWTPLHFAVISGSHEVFNALTQGGSSLDCVGRMPYDLTLLDCARISGYHSLPAQASCIVLLTLNSRYDVPHEIGNTIRIRLGLPLDGSLQPGEDTWVHRHYSRREQAIRKVLMATKCDNPKSLLTLARFAEAGVEFW